MMANVNKKVYTDHSLMDEVVYQLKIIVNSILLKNENTANENETEESITESDYFISCKNGTMELSFFPMTIQLLMDYGYSLFDAQTILNDRDEIPEEDREDLLNYLVTRYINEYDEKNNYYRCLNGLPDYGTTKYDIKIDPSDPRLIEDDNNTDFNFSLPIHQYGNKELNTLKSLGIINDLYEEHKGDPHYKYLYYLNTVRIDIYEARIAANWDILFIPNCENLVKSRFKELFTINKEIYSKRTYQMAYSYMSEYYDEMIMVMIIAQTFADIIAELPEWYIRRDIFDLRSAQYFLESQGVRFFKQIPLKYQIKLVKNLNRLIKYKSTNKNIHDILEIFGIAGTTVYKYYIYKDYLPDSATDYDDIDENGNKFKLAFIQVPIDESFDEYMQDNMYHKDYDVVTTLDKYWDSINPLDDEITKKQTHDLVKKQHCEKDFSIEGTKYMFLDYDIDMIKYRFQLSYFLGMIFSSKVFTENLNIMIPSISDSNYYSITELCMLLCCLEGPYLGRTVEIHIPMIDEREEWHMEDRYDFGDEEIDTIYYNPALGGVKYDFGVNYAVDPTKPYNRYDFGDEEDIETDTEITPDTDDELSEDNYIGKDTGDWMKNKYPYFWKNTRYMIYGFNLLADLKQLEENISVRHSAFGFEHGYTLADFGCDTFMTTKKIDTIDQLNEIYMNNKQCFDNLMDFFENKCDTRDKAVVAQYVFDNLFLTEFDLDFYTLKSGNVAEYYIDLLKERSFSLYKFYMELTKEPDLEVQKDGIRNILNEIVTTLEYFIGNQTNLEFIFSFVPTSSSEAIIEYLSLVINFFKSWKVYFLDPSSTYTISDKFDDQSKFYENISELKYEYWKDDHNSLRDSFYTAIQIYLTDPLYTFTKEIMEIYGYFDIDPNFDNVYNGAYPSLDPTEDIIDANGGIVNDCIPFVMVNGGTPFGVGLFDTITLDGGGPHDERIYSNIDGYVVDDPNGKQIKGNNLEPVGYPIFGGFPGKQWSDSIYTHISDLLVLSNDVQISTYTLTNDLKVDGNRGLYLGNENGITDYITRNEYNEFVTILDDVDGRLVPLAYNYWKFEELFSSESYLISKVNKETDSILYPVLAVAEGTITDNIINYYIYSTNNFNSWFNDINPFAWELIE